MPDITENETRLRKWIHDRIEGRCEILSKGFGGCTCALCDFEMVQDHKIAQALVITQLNQRVAQLEWRLQNLPNYSELKIWAEFWSRSMGSGDHWRGKRDAAVDVMTLLQRIENHEPTNKTNS